MKIKFTFIIIYCFTLIIVLSACGGSLNPSPTAFPSPTLTATNTPLPSPTSTPSPTPILPSGLISFDSNREGGWGIFLVNADGSGETNILTISPGDGDEYAFWSPDGKRIAFQSYRGGNTSDLYVINSDSSGLSRLTKNDTQEIKPSWSPDGKQIAFYKSENGEPPYELYIMVADGSGLIKLTSGVAGLTAPSWSPDGSQIAFDANSGDQLEIFIINTSGGAPEQITSNSASGEPDWSPDGEKIAFASGRNGGADIYSMNADGSQVVQLTRNSTSYEPSWSPDGNFITFTSERSGNPEIYVMKADGSDVMQLTDDPADDYAPQWAPIGVSISDEPWFGPPFCMLDTNGDFQPDTQTIVFKSQEIGFIMFPFRNMTDGEMFGHQWTFSDSGFNPMFMSPWDGGKSGWHTLYSFISSGAGEVKIQLFVGDKTVQEVVCGIVE